MHSSAQNFWNNREILICVGPGGVGKTTAAASLALAAAKNGKKTLGHKSCFEI